MIAAVFSLSRDRAQALEAAGKGLPEPVTTRALLDTGASSTAVDSRIIERLELSPRGEVPVATPSTGAQPARRFEYDSALFIPSQDGTEAGLVFPLVPVLGTDLRPTGVDALIGRDVLSKCIFIYNGTTGTFSLAY